MILVTNDDGDSEGVRILLEAAKKMDNSVAIVPNRQRSAVSCALTLHKPIRLNKLEKDVFSINGTPSDCVLFSMYTKDFERPNMILSGINWGDNTGMSAILGSGTIGACWQAVLEGIPAVAFSMHTKNHDWREKSSWGDRKKLLKIVSDVLKSIKPKMGPGKFFNVNLPDELASPKIVYTNSVQMKRYKTQITKRFDPNGVPYFWITGSDEKMERGTDSYEVMNNKNISITEITASFFGVSNDEG